MRDGESPMYRAIKQEEENEKELKQVRKLEEVKKIQRLGTK